MCDVLMTDVDVANDAQFNGAIGALLGQRRFSRHRSCSHGVIRSGDGDLQDRLPPPVALRQAQLWLREATNAKLDAYLSQHEAFALARQQESERMPLVAVHMLLGPVLKGDPNERPYSHPYYWAPFVFPGPRRRCEGLGSGFWTGRLRTGK